MIKPMRHRLAICLAAGLFTLAVPGAAYAQDDEDKSYDARLEGHEPAVTLEGGGTAPTDVLHIDADVIEHFRKSGQGWQKRVNEALRKAAGLG